MAHNPAKFQKFITGLEYPVSKDELIAHAREKGADDEVISMLEELDEEHFDTPREVNEALASIEVE